MKLKNPTQTRRTFDEQGYDTISKIADATSMSTHTISRVLRGQLVQYKTIKKIADFLDVNEEEIAEVVQ